MINKRIIGVVNIKSKLAVQSYGFNKYLPIGDPLTCIENLNRWKVDEILVHVIDQSSFKSGPDFELLKKISTLKLTTPLIYGGGIRDNSDAQKVIEFGADRISISDILNTSDYDEKIQKISIKLGSQAIILSIPCVIYKNKFLFYNYKEKLFSSNNLVKVNKLISADLISEILLIDKLNEGYAQKFNEDLLKKSLSKILIKFFLVESRIQLKLMLYSQTKALLALL